MKRLLFVPVFLLATNMGFGQPVSSLYEEIQQAYNSSDYERTVDLCRQVLTRCAESVPDVECRFTDVMKSVYRYKGFAEYQLYLKDRSSVTLDAAILSLKKSYELFGDPEIAFNFGYMESLRAIELQDGTYLDGLVHAWQGVLGLYAKNEWAVNQELVDKIRIFINQAVELTITPPDSAVTNGLFSSFMVRLACDLAEKGVLSPQDSLYFRVYRQRAVEDEFNLRGNEWRARGFAAQKDLNTYPDDYNYRQTRRNLELAYKHAKSTQRKAEMLKELTKVALFMEKEGINNHPEADLQYAREKAQQAYDLLVDRGSNIRLSLATEIKKVYGNAIFRLVNYYFSFADSTNRLNAYARAKRVGEELLVPDGAFGRKQKFEWDGYEDLYLRLSEIGYEIGDKEFAVDMVDKAWKSVLDTNGLSQSNLCGQLSNSSASELMPFATVYRRIAERFGLQPVLLWLRPMIKCIADHARNLSSSVREGD
ncbi:hypothetical protein GWO43_26910 [candidate division KSB1 bacterium]|nr:hypothetical protein [candidate division KSB1 bacterium]NIR70188.1 hypothetical protein [candidate division KSB1 bacterium]NIS27575.1 hypothetical protein [candidate division KSB1 bacterium]NIT74427.1 hypothetical protein [candidate division KSB1 bacterium]NIU28292.1 hypothetical protein [candidate division KSB1 bacterium]